MVAELISVFPTQPIELVTLGGGEGSWDSDRMAEVNVTSDAEATAFIVRLPRG